MNALNAHRSTVRLPRGAARRAVRLSYVQSMVGAVYAASTGGMFLIGFALMLGATNAQIGLMSTIPMLCIGVQLLTAALVERGVSRRKLTFIRAAGGPADWHPHPGHALRLRAGQRPRELGGRLDSRALSRHFLRPDGHVRRPDRLSFRHP